MEKFETEVYRYLIYLQEYLEGDLKKFEKLCDEAEKAEKERSEESEENEENEDSIQTTMYPGSFEFIHGEPIIARSTIPHTLTLFATVDILGFLLRGKDDYWRTKKNLKSFFNNLSTKFEPLEVKVLTEIYRNGLVHNYFPLLNMAIAYRSEYPDDKMFLKKGNELILNIKFLKKIVTERLNEIINDETLYSDMEKQYSILVKDYEKKCRRNINELKLRI